MSIYCGLNMSAYIKLTFAVSFRESHNQSTLDGTKVVVQAERMEEIHCAEKMQNTREK